MLLLVLLSLLFTLFVLLILWVLFSIVLIAEIIDVSLRGYEPSVIVIKCPWVIAGLTERKSHFRDCFWQGFPEKRSKRFANHD